MGHENLVGQTFGQYELRDLLGLGGMGAVYRGFQTSLKREVAVKVLPSSLATEAGYAERFNREAQTAAALEHPHIVSIFDYGTQRGTSYLVMRLLNGGTLAQRLQPRDNKLTLPSLGETSILLNQLASALAYAHAQGVIHRDIKTSNVMFDNQGNAYLVDFGIAKLMGAQSGLTGTGMAMGTPTYMPPEQWAGQELTPAADQYALGVLVYAMVTGRVPFEANTPYELLHKHLNELPTPATSFRADVPEAVNRVLARALSKNPGDRFPSVTALSQAFDSGIEGVKGDPTTFFTSKIDTRQLRPINQASPSPVSGVQTGMAPGSGQQRTYHPGSTQPPVTGTMPVPLTKNPLFYGVIVMIVLLVAILGVLLGSRDGGNGDGDNEATPTSNLIVLADSPTPTEAPATETLAPTDTATDEPTATAEVRASATTEFLGEIDYVVQSGDTLFDIAQANNSTVDAILAANDMTGDSTIFPGNVLKIPVPEAVVAEETKTQVANPSITPAERATQSGTGEPGSSETPTNFERTQAAAVLAVSATDEPTPTLTPSDVPPTPTDTATNTDVPPTATATATNTDVPTATATDTSTHTLTPTDTPTDTPTATFTASATATDTPSNTPTDTPTNTPTPTATFTDTPTATPTPDFASFNIVFFAFKNGNADLFLTDETGATPVQITSELNDEVDPAWSPDGSKIVYASNRDGNYNLYVINPAGTDEVQLTFDTSDERAPTWSPDGQYIAFQSNLGTITSDIFVIRDDGTSLVQLTTHPAYDLAPSWSANGTKIAFHTQRQGGDNDIAIMDFNGANQIIMTDNSAYDADPAFERGGNLLFESDRDGGAYKIYRMDTTTGDVTPVTSGPEDYYPSYGHFNGGDVFVFEARRAGSATFELAVLIGGTETFITQGLDASSAAWMPDRVYNSRVQPLPVIETLPTTTPVPTMTATTIPTESPTADPSVPTETPAPSVFMSIGTRAILVYDRPVQSATAVSVSGQRVAVTGVTADSAWYRISINDREGWVQVNSSGWTITGSTTNLPLAAPAIADAAEGDPGFLTVMFQSGFETLPPVIENTGWDTVLLDNEISLCSSDAGAFMSFGDPSWKNYEVSLEFQFRGREDGKFYLITRMDETHTGIRYAISADDKTVSTYTLRLPSGRSLPMSEVNINIRAKQWGLLRSEADGIKIRTFFEGLQTVEYELLSADFSQGYVGLEAEPGTIVCLNNLVVRSLYRSQEALNAAIPRATVGSNANMRLFPGQGFTAVSAATSGESVYVITTNDDKTWTYIRRDLTRNPAEGWIASSLISINE